MAEEVIIKIELEKNQNEKEVDAMTRKITDLTKANNELKKSNNELIKSGQENSKEFIENTRQMEINKQKIQEATSSRKNLITTLIAEDDSIKGLKARNAELIKQRDQLSTSTQAGRDAIAAINKELDKNNQTIKENTDALGQQKINIGNYKSALDGIVPGLGGFIDGIQGATKAAIAFIATPLGAILGAIGLAIGALTAYFKGSEEGQNKFNKLAAIGSAILEQFMNVVEDIGGAIVSAFEDPQAAMESFVGFLKDQIINRFTGLAELIPKLGQAITLLFEGEFAAAGKVAGDAVGKVVLGIENATDKIAGFIKSTGDLIDAGIANGQRLADLNARIDKDERALIVDRQKIGLEVLKLRTEAIEQEGELRQKTVKEAIALEEQLAARETQLAKERLALRELELKANGDDKEALKAVAEARAAVFAAEASAFQNTIKLRKELEALTDKQREKDAKHAEELAALEAQDEAAELARFERLRAAQESLQETQLEQAVKNAESVQARVDAEIALEQFKLATQLADNVLYQAEIEALQAKSQANITAIKRKGVEDQAKLDEDARKKKEQLDKIAVNQETAGRQAAGRAAIAVTREVFGNNKVAAAAEVTLNTIQAVSRAYHDYAFPYSLIVSVLMGALGAVQIGKIAGVTLARGGLLAVNKVFGRGGVSQTGGVLRGPSHAMGGIPFSVGGRLGFEAEGGEAIINKRSTQMFKPILSQINQAGGGVAFQRGGITRFQTGSVVASTQTRQAAANADARMDASRIIAALDKVQTVLVLEDFEAKQGSVDTNRNTAVII